MRPHPPWSRRGEGLLGARRRRRHAAVRDVPDGYPAGGVVARPRSLAECSPAHATATCTVHAVLELDSFARCTPTIGSCSRAWPRCWAWPCARRATGTGLEELLEETQRQAEELQAQQEELRVSNEELEEQTRALSESQAQLETQQAELEQTNAQPRGAGEPARAPEGRAVAAPRGS